MTLFADEPSSEVSIPLAKLSNLLCQELALVVANKLECRAIIEQLLDYYLGVDPTDYLPNRLCTIQPSIQIKLLNGLKRLQNYEPIQYVIGSTYFAGNPFMVTADVLIPRPETEEWVTFVINHVIDPTSILDIGTGSGCIAITLKQAFPQAVVDAVDISKEALTVAMHNASKLGAVVHFIQSDILTQSLPSCSWSLIVSNPPYVRMQEKALMHRNVLNYEPHLALFVDDDDPLVFYKRIIELASHHLQRNGLLCLEINEALGKNVVNLLHSANFNQIALHKDMRQKERWVMATLDH